MSSRDPTSELGHSFNGPVYRDPMRLGLVTTNNAGITLATVHAPGVVEDTTDAGYLDGLVELGSGDGLRTVFVFEGGSTSPVAMLGQMEPFGRGTRLPLANTGDWAQAYIHRPVSDVAGLALTAGTVQIGASLAAALGNGALSTWVFAKAIGTPTAPVDGFSVYNPGIDSIAHMDYFPAQGVEFLRVQLSQTGTTKKMLALVRKLRGDAQGT